MNRKPFTLADGLDVQSDHLARWKRLLKPEVYAALEAYATSENAKTALIHRANGYDVTRGKSLDSFVFNLALTQFAK